MTNDLKQRVQRAVEKYQARIDKENGPNVTKRKNESPEKDVVKELIKWLKANNFYCNIVEAKAVYSEKLGIYHHGQTAPGHSDISGTTPQGLSCAVEAKAPGKCNTLRAAQYHFLTETIKRFGFACCVDSVEMLEEIYNKFLSLDGEERKTYLISMLKMPKELKDDGEKLFDDFS